ncbi:MAG: hypothetical protein IT297_09490 [Anaerolineae bacterium]|nr:hypothetical protein [Anaerolineae bacterium]MCZ7551667.1 hypothetical protein [Anaerolineales bacterium]
MNAIIFGITASIVALTVYLITNRNIVASICAWFFFISTASIIEAHAMAWSEPLFIIFSLSSLILLSIYVVQPTTSLFIASALSLGFALITRYIGIAFLPAALVLVFIGGRDRNVWQRSRATFTWFVFAVAILGIWLTRNKLIGGAATNRHFAFHPISVLKYSRDFVSVLSGFFIPIPLSAGIRLSILGLFILSILIPSLFAIKYLQRTKDWRRIAIVLIVACLLFVFSYTLFLLISISFVDAATPVDSRILLPILVISILGIFSAVWIIPRILRKSAFYWGFLILAIFSILIKSSDAIHHALSIQKNGLGYTSRHWQESESIAFIKSLTKNVEIYSNGNDVISFLTRRQVHSIPAKTNAGTMVDNEDFDKDFHAICKNVIENKALLVYLNNITWRWYLPSQTEIETTCNLPVLENLEDGTVYGLK